MPVRSLSFAASSVFGSMLVVLAHCGGDRTTGAPAADPGSKLSVPNVPENLRPARGEVLTTKAVAKGTQNYECKAGEGTTYAWRLIAPEADLSDDAGKLIAHHYAGPTWESTDGSKVVGEVTAHADAPGSQGIPWLLLKTKTNSGTGMFGNVTTVQRLDTSGGLAPATGCDAQHVGAKQNVPYTATYYFYSAQ